MIFILMMCFTVPTFGGESLPRSQSSLAQEMMKVELQDLRRRLFEANMANLTPADAGKFWAIFADYDREKSQLDESGLMIMDQYMTNFLSLEGKEVSVLMADLARRQLQQLKLREKTYKTISRKISPVIGARFFQLDGYLEAIQRVKSMERLPLIGNSLQK